MSLGELKPRCKIHINTVSILIHREKMGERRVEGLKSRCETEERVDQIHERYAGRILANVKHYMIYYSSITLLI